MTKKEFIIEAALRMVATHRGTSIDVIASMARELADNLFLDACMGKEEFRDAPIDDLMGEVERMEQEGVMEKIYGAHRSGCIVRLQNVFRNIGIMTVGDLLDYGRRAILRERNIGNMSIEAIDKALENLYNVKTW